MIPSKNLIDYVKKRESLSLKTYLCPSGKLTAGWGHTGPEVKEGEEYSLEQCIHWLADDLNRAAAVVNRDVHQQLTQSQFDALVDFVFNCGSENFEESTLLKDITDRDLKDVPKQLIRWVHGTGKQILPGLVKRRQDEIRMWNGDFNNG